jgi:hypothetical protein
MQPNYDQVLKEAFSSAVRVDGFQGLNKALQAKPRALVVLYKRELFTQFKQKMALATPQVRIVDHCTHCSSLLMLRTTPANVAHYTC